MTKNDGWSNELGGTVHGVAVQSGSIENLHLHVVSPKPVVAPRQVPRPPARFVNRSRELSALDAATTATGGPAPVVVVSGLNGVGKSAIASRWAHQAHRFDDGHLFADVAAMRQAGGVSVSDLLGEFLRALGVPADDIPASLRERSNLFRSRTADLRLLVVLDGVEFAAEVIPLLPSSERSAVVVTSRSHLDELLIDGATLLLMRPLDDVSGTELLSETIGLERVQEEPSAAAAIVEMCGGLPVALRICGARLAAHPTRSLAWLISELSGDEVPVGDTAGTVADDGLGRVFDGAYSQLPPELARLYGLAGLFAQPSVLPGPAAALLDVTPAQADRMLEQLVSLSLIDEIDPSTYTFHGLVRRHARGVGQLHLTQSERGEAFRRFADWFLDRCDIADLATIPDRLRLRQVRTRPDLRLGSSAEALRWFHSHHLHVLAVIRSARSLGLHDHVWQLAEATWLYYFNRKPYAEWIEVSRAGVESAHEVGRLDAESRLRCQLARAQIELHEFADAERELEEALDLARRWGHRALEGSVLEFTGILRFEQGRDLSAQDLFEDAWRIYADLGYVRGAALQCYHQGKVLLRLERFGDAVGQLQSALSGLDPETDELTCGRVLVRLGEAFRRWDHLVEAEESISAALEIMRNLGVELEEARALESLGDLEASLGDEDRARQLRIRALALYERLGSPRAGDLASLL